MAEQITPPFHAMGRIAYYIAAIVSTTSKTFPLETLRLSRAGSLSESES